MQSDRDFRRHLAHFELDKAKRLVAEGRTDRAIVALRRARLWRTQSIGASRAAPDLAPPSAMDSQLTTTRTSAIIAP